MKGDFIEEKKSENVPGWTLSWHFRPIHSKYEARQGDPLPETWDEQGVLQLRLAIDGEFWAKFL